MGTAMAPNFSNILMAHLEENFLENEPIKPLMWVRYIDDIFMVWQGTDIQLQDLLTRLNAAHPIIKFTYEFSGHQAFFPDLLLHKGERFRTSGILDMRTHFKQTNKFQYVHYTSDHTDATKKAVVLGDCTRILRKTSDSDTYRTIVDNFVERLAARGYPRHTSKRLTATMPFEKRPDTLRVKHNTDNSEHTGCHDNHSNTHTHVAHGNRATRTSKSKTTHNTRDRTSRVTKSKTNRMIFPITRSPWFTRIERIATKNWRTMILTDTDLDDRLGNSIMFAHKRNRKVRDTVVRAKMRDEPHPPVLMTNTIDEPPLNITYLTRQSGHSQCGTCPRMTRSCDIRSSVTKRTHPIDTRMECTTTGVIYVITCAVCSKQYVGQTGVTLRNRVRHHLNKMHGGCNRKIYRHFNERNHNPSGRWFITPIQRETDPKKRLRLECEWVNRLRTAGRFGLNARVHATYSSQRLHKTS